MKMAVFLSSLSPAYGSPGLIVNIDSSLHLMKILSIIYRKNSLEK